MDIQSLKSILVKSIDDLYTNDFHLIKHNLAEQSITHRLAFYIDKNLNDPSLNVDCEYNGDLQNEENRFRKNISILSSKLIELKQSFQDSELTSRYIFPDIIIHKRGTSERNLLIIEVKKKYPRRSMNGNFDRLKLSHFTSDEFGNHLKYGLGVFLEITTETDNKEFLIDYYINGEKQ